MSSFNGLNPTGTFSSQATSDPVLSAPLAPGAPGTTNQVSGIVTVPAGPGTSTPEPFSLGLVGLKGRRVVSRASLFAALVPAHQPR